MKIWMIEFEIFQFLLEIEVIWHKKDLPKHNVKKVMYIGWKYYIYK